MDLNEAKKVLKGKLRDLLKVGGDEELNVYYWNVPEARISEISVFKPHPEKGRPFGQGYSFMQSDPPAAILIFYAERYLAHLIHMSDSEEEQEEVTYAEESLKNSVHFKVKYVDPK